MTAKLTQLSLAQLAERLAAGRAILIDIRETDEFARRRVRGALSRPLQLAPWNRPART